jgi:hypothetical protein
MHHKYLKYKTKYLNSRDSMDKNIKLDGGGPDKIGKFKNFYELPLRDIIYYNSQAAIVDLNQSAAQPNDFNFIYIYICVCQKVLKWI